MADPVSWAAIAGIAGAGISASSTIAGGNRAAAASNAAADLAPFNMMLRQKQAEIANRQADNAELEGKYQKQSLIWQGDTALASAQNQQRDAARRGKIALSNLQAAAAFGGGNASSADVVNNAGLIGGQSRYEQLINLYNGEVARNAAIDQGNIAEYASKQKAIALRSQAANYNTQGIMDLAQGSLDRANASIIRNNAYAGAAGTLLGSAAQMGLSYKQAGGNLSKSVNDIANNYWSPFPSNNYNAPRMS